MEQTTIIERSQYTAKIGELLLALREDPKSGEPPQMGEYISGWNRMCEVPNEALPYVLNVLQAELKCRKQVGDTAYFSSRTIEQKTLLYLMALTETEDSYADEGLHKDHPISWVDFKQRFAGCLGKEMGAASGNE